MLFGWTLCVVLLYVVLCIALMVTAHPTSVTIKCEDAPTEPSKPDRIFYNKVPKCGSRTLNHIFKKVSEVTGLKLSGEHPFHGREVDLEEEEALVKRIANIEAGSLFNRHVFLPNFERFGEEYPAVINMIRDPVDKLISGYYYARQMEQERNFTSMTRRIREMTLDECVEQRLPGCMNHNGYLVFFCGQDPMCRVVGPKSLARAKENVCKHYHSIGILEDMRPFMEVLEYLYPTYMRGIVNIYDESVNELHSHTATSTRVEPSPEHMDALKHALRYEYDFYIFVKERFYEQYETILDKS